MKCLNCQSENPEGTEFCRACGAKLEKICPKCEFPNPSQFEFCGKCGQRLEKRAETQKAVPASEGERKHATVLFSDLSGYTAMTERLDPEDVKEIMSEIFGKIEQVVTKYEGLVERFFGDEVMVLFGVPKAHEDDPVRAIRAAREIQELVEGMSPDYEVRVGQPLTMHIGINTGLVITGDEYIGKGRHGLTGDTVNLAARLTKLAQSGEILVGPDTYSQAEGHFAFESLEPTKVKGKEEAVRIYKALSPREEPTKVRRTRGVRAELIGRKEEMVQLGAAVERLRQGESTIISVCGDAGTGKSRLVEEFKASLDLEEIQWREGHAYAYCQNVPYFPIIDMINRAWQIEEGDPPEAVREKIESSIESLVGKKQDVIPYIGGLYSLDYPEIAGVDPEFWKMQLRQAIHEILAALAQRAPTVICLEDLHWADPSSSDLFRSIISAFSRPALFLCVYRSDFELFSGHHLNNLDKSYQEIRLEDLSPLEAQHMTVSLLDSKTIPRELQRFVQERLEGNPFYLEEVINSLIESETLIRDNGTWRLASSISESGISPTVHGVISGRLDRLDKESKRILQEASVIGRAFLYEILKRITDLKEHIDQRLSGLERLDLIRTRSLQPELEYIFKHALTQEVVYEGLLKKERQAIHERIGTVMEQLFHDRLFEFCEPLGFHFKEGLSTIKAVDYLVKSGEKSVKRYALEESHRYYKDAFDLLGAKPDQSEEEEGLLIDLLIKWSYVFYYRGDFKGLGHLLRAHKDVAESLGDKARLGMFYAWLGWALHNGHRLKEGHEYLLRALALGEEIGDQYVIGYACTWLTWNCGNLGLPDKALAYGARAQQIAPLFPWDQYFYYDSLTAIGFAHFAKGDGKKALEAGMALLDYGQEHSNMRSQSFGHWVVGMGHAASGDFHEAIECCEKALQLTQDPYYSHLIRALLGFSCVMTGEFQEAEILLKETMASCHELGSAVAEIEARGLLALISIASGRMSSGFTTFKEVYSEVLSRQSTFLYLVCEYMMGKLYLEMVQGPVPSLSVILKNLWFLIRNVPFAGRRAAYHLNKTIEMAADMGAKGLEAQAYFDLGLLHKAKGRIDKARESISRSIRLFEECEAEGFLRQAKEALESLG